MVNVPLAVELLSNGSVDLNPPLYAKRPKDVGICLPQNRPRNYGSTPNHRLMILPIVETDRVMYHGTWERTVL